MKVKMLEKARGVPGLHQPSATMSTARRPPHGGVSLGGATIEGILPSGTLGVGATIGALEGRKFQ